MKRGKKAIPVATELPGVLGTFSTDQLTELVLYLRELDKPIPEYTSTEQFPFCPGEVFSRDKHLEDILVSLSQNEIWYLYGLK